ncbi:hypothetical protein [Breoghania sp.]|uniref:hypothetical protein n=1 Tax=Breoghania sp. TaxID=2065378 RepID=UPI002AAB5922|nr:hypothetical protein [Breoghania sp.]
MRKIIDIEALLFWALGDQGVADEFREEAYGAGYAASAWEPIERLAQLGTLVDGRAGNRFGSGDIHRDAMAVGDAIRALEPEVRGMVICYGITGARPAWDYQPELRPVIGINGKPVVIRERVKGLRGWRDDVVGCELELRPSLETARAAWMRYREWWMGLAYLQALLKPILSDHEVTGPCAPFEPWIGTSSEALVSAVLGDLRVDDDRSGFVRTRRTA